jgi:hypothetical protein
MRSVDENGDESGLRVERIPIVHRSRRRYRRPKGQGAGDRLTRTATRTDNEWRDPIEGQVTRSNPQCLGRSASTAPTTTSGPREKAGKSSPPSDNQARDHSVEGEDCSHLVMLEAESRGMGVDRRMAAAA